MLRWEGLRDSWLKREVLSLDCAKLSEFPLFRNFHNPIGHEILVGRIRPFIQLLSSLIFSGTFFYE